MHLLAKSSQFRRQVGLRFIHLITMTGLLRKQGKLGYQLFVKGTDSLLVLVLFFVLNLLSLTEPSDHPLVGHIPVLQGLYLYQCLK